MKILFVNKFLKPAGGSETYIIKLGGCLKKKGHQVQYFGMDDPERTLTNSAGQYTVNLDFHTKGARRFLYPFQIIYSWEAKRKLMKVMEEFRPDIVHLNNFNYQLTPSVIYGVKSYEKKTGKRAALFYTAHDYQLLCPDHMLNSPADHKNCERCVKGHYMSCIKKKCIHSSRVKSVLGAIEGALYRTLKTYRYIDRIICPSYFLEMKMNEVALFRGKTETLHNFIDCVSGPVSRKKDYVLYFGRFSREKGMETLVRACRELPDIPFVFAGDGPLKGLLQEADNITYAGFLEGEALNRLIREARFSVYPSEYYENCPFSVIESQLFQTPVLGARIGGIPELIRDGVDGILFTSGDFEDLKEKIQYLWESPKLCEKLAAGCRSVRYDTVERYCDQLLKLYRAELGQKRER